MIKDRKMLPYQILLLGSLGLYLWKQSKRNNELGEEVRFNIDTDKLSQAVIPYLPVHEKFHPEVRTGLKNTLDTLLNKVKK